MQATKQAITCDFSNAALYNAAYIPLFANKARFLHLYGSAGSGKSVFACQKEIVLSFSPERKGRRTLVVRAVHNTLKDSVYAELVGVIADWGLDDHFECLKSPLSITNRLTGVRFIFRGLDDVEKLKSVKGVDRILIEEATEIKARAALDQLSLRLRGFAEVQVTLMYNPVNEFHWLNTDFHQQRDAEHFLFKTTYKDNVKMLARDPHYAPTIEKFKFTNPNYYRVYVLGEWGKNVEGLIYPDYVTVPEMPPVQVYGLDFGYNDPCALVAVSTEDVMGVEAKNLYWKELLYKTHLTSATLIKELDELGVDKNVTIVADSARPEMIADIRGAGYSIRPCVKYPGSVVEGISMVKKYNLKLVAGGKNLFREATNYAWKEKNGKFCDDEPVDAVNHLMDGGRYGTEEVDDAGGAISVGPTGPAAKQQKSMADALRERMRGRG
jgi:phage terminase large subunit